ncbi:DNA invertase (fragment) [Xenorhabdus nematophila str. Anatoliense]
MPELRARQQKRQSELQTLINQTSARMSVLYLAETLTTFLQRLRESTRTLDIGERQHIVRLLIKDVLINDDTIVIRHSIPLTNPPFGDNPPSLISSGLQRSGECYLLRSGCVRTTLRHPLLPFLPLFTVKHFRFKVSAYQFQ